MQGLINKYQRLKSIFQYTSSVFAYTSTCRINKKNEMQIGIYNSRTHTRRVNTRNAPHTSDFGRQFFQLYPQHPRKVPTPMQCRVDLQRRSLHTYIQLPFVSPCLYPIVLMRPILCALHICVLVCEWVIVHTHCCVCGCVYSSVGVGRAVSS